MAFTQTVSFTDPPKRPFAINDYSGGLNNVSEVLSNQARNLLNVSFTDGLLMEKRLGIKPIEDMSLSLNTDVIFIDEFKLFTSSEVVNCTKHISTSEYKFCANKQALVTVSGPIQGTTFMGKYFFVDGANIWVYKGGGVVPLKLKNPPAGYTPAPSPAVIGVWKEDSTHTWYEPCVAEVNDQYKGVNVIPIAPKLITSSAGRLYMSGCLGDENNVYISDLENGFYYPPTLPIQADPNGEKVTALKVFHDVVIVGRNESIYALYGNTNRPDTGEQYLFKKINSHTGIYNQNTCQLMHDYMVYLGSDGVIYRMITPLTDVRQITSTVLSRSLNLFTSPLSLTFSDFIDSTATFYNDSYHIKLGKFVLVFSYLRQAWTVYDNIDALYMKTIDNKIFICSKRGQTYTFKSKEVNIIIPSPARWPDDENWVDEEVWEVPFYETNRAYSDTVINSSGVLEVLPITAFWSSKRFDLNDPTRYKHFREMFVVTSTWKDYVSNISVRFEIDFVDIENILEVKDKIAVWGRVKWGDRLINKDIAASIPTQIGRRGRYISFTIANDNIDEPMKVHEVAGDYILRGRR